MSFIYKLIYRDEVVYVGQSKNISTMHSRFSCHYQDKVFNKTEFFEVDELNVDRVEYELINEIRPKYNKTMRFDEDMATKTELKKAMDKSIDRLFEAASSMGCGVIRGQIKKIHVVHAKKIENDFSLFVDDYIDSVINSYEIKRK